ncbi:MAG: DNA polymerase I [Eubacteriales bacterium]|nr:DNA polymerase I [Eubacteriales bacterium]MDD3200221.1 DNA polymerase I [Eubacteriales bacterium]MDD4630472.1 DNA polymerase I [Eubacteriales bacterium]
MKIIIIDGNSLINRAYYAMQRPMMTKTGLYTQGVYGFLNILNRIRTDYQPDYIAVTFDRKAPTFRHIEYADYKAGRKKMPPELAMQIPLLKEVLDAMKIKILEMDGYEADDIIGTVAKRAEAEGLETMIITGDKDELQLATEHTKVLITKKGISEFELYDEAAIMEKYGFLPEQFIDFKGLMGDPSDNIPGIPGVGEKTALKLIHEFGSVASLIANVDKVESKSIKSKIEDNAQLALMSRRLATINTEVPIEIDFEEFKAEDPDYNALIDQYIKLEFNSFLKKMPIGKKEKAVSRSTVKQIQITDEKGIKQLKEELQNNPNIIIKVFNDHNHIDKPVIYGISILSTDSCYFIKPESIDLLRSLLQLLQEGIKISGHNLKEDYYALLCNNNFDAPTKDALFKTEFDTMIAQYLIDTSRSNYSLKSLMLEYFHEQIEEEADFLKENGQLGFLPKSEQIFIDYGTKWCLSVEKLIHVLNEKLIEEELYTVFNEIELPLIEALASMENIGFAVDRKELMDAGNTISEKIKELTVKIHSLAGEEFNINSPQQLGVILFEKLGIPYAKKTKRGYATGAEVLEKIKDDYEIVGLILEYRMYSKLKSTYIEGLLPLIHLDNKIHAHFQQTVASTGRISCTEPNLQNIPIRHELGRKLRKAFIPESEEYILVSADYSQIELRILAHLSQDPLLVEAFNQGADIHKITASKVLGIPEDQVTARERSNAKAVNFGIIYGMSGFGLSTELNITRKEAEKYIQEYFKKYTKVKEFLDGLVASCREKGYVTTISKRKRVIHEINASNYMVRQAGERLAMNSPIQGSAADIIKIAMIKVYSELNRRNLKSKLILQVHDELIIQAHISELDIVKDLIVANMENAVKLSVKLTSDVSTGKNWYELK